MFQQSAEYKLRVMGAALQRNEVTLAEADRLFEEPLVLVTWKDAEARHKETLVEEFGTFSANLDYYKILIDHRKYPIPPPSSPVYEVILFGVDDQGVIRAYVRTLH